jgi:ABC-type amino acid transport substrate-binding protein
MWLLLLFGTLSASLVCARDLDDVRKAGVLRHLGIPYANFVTGTGTGLDVELMQRFADFLGVRYEYVQTSWSRAFGDLTGRNARRRGTDAELLEEVPIRGDLIANGMTVLPWREQIVSFSDPTFPSGVWLVARADSPLVPITPSNSTRDDVRRVKSALAGHSVLGLENTCLDPGLYRLESTGAQIRLPDMALKLNEMVPAVLNQEAETTLLDVPDALIALEKWPGEVKVVGPISEDQLMAVAFRKTSPELRRTFNGFLKHLRAGGTYERLVRRYYPAVFRYYGDFFADSAGG